jgi:hypothetical protein
VKVMSPAPVPPGDIKRRHFEAMVEIVIGEAGVGVEPTRRGFADLGLPTWLPRRSRCEGGLE